MIEPTLALQTAINARLTNTPAVTALVAPEQIRTSLSRPKNLPAIMMDGAQTEYLGNAAGGQYLARVWLDLHIWALDAGSDTAKAIGFAVHRALLEWPVMTGCKLDDFEAANVFWLRDPKPEFAHGIMKLEAVIRWSV